MMFLFFLTLISLWLEGEEVKQNFKNHSEHKQIGFTGEISGNAILWDS